MRHPVLASSLIVGLLSCALWAQGQKPPPPTKPPSTPPTRPAPGQGQARPQREQPRVVFLSGSVLYADGARVSEPLMVELRCNGNTRSQVWSSVDGSFTFQLGGQRELSSFDVSVSGSGFGTPGAGRDPSADAFGLDPFATRDRTRALNLSSCEIRLAQAGYKAQPIRLGMRSSLDNPDVGVLVIEQRPGVLGSLVSVRTLSAPKKARKSYQKAERLLGKKEPQLDKATLELEKALAIYPEFAAAWQLLGKVKATGEDWEGARECFRKAVSHDPEFLPPYLSLGQLELKLEDYPAASEVLDRALELNPYAIEVRFSSGLAHYYQGHLEQAQDAFQTVQGSEQADRYPGIHYALGLVYAQRGLIAEAAAELRLHLERFPDGDVAERIHLQLAQWQSEGLITP